MRFDGKLRRDFHGAKITSDAGFLPFRELDEAFRLTEAASVMLSDSRRGKNTQHTLLAMLRQAVYGRLAGYEDVNDAERLRVDPAVLFGTGLQPVIPRTEEVRKRQTVGSRRVAWRAKGWAPCEPRDCYSGRS